MGEPLTIDEAQYAPKLFRYIKHAVDQKPGVKGRIVVTGSLTRELLQRLSEGLSGRVEIFELNPLSWSEVKARYAQRGVKPLEFLWRGGYPELLARDDIGVEWFISSYMVSYMERDLRSQLRVGDLQDFHRFLRMLALTNAQMLNMSEIARDVGVSVPTIKSWLSALETSQIVYLLEPFYRNVGKRIVKTPKVYFRDTGLLCALWGVGKAEDLWETYVLNELLKARPGGGHWRNLYYYRDSGGLEVDFVVGGVKPKLIEAKWAEVPTTRDWANLVELRQRMGQDVTREVSVVCRSGGNYDMGDGVKLCDGWGDEGWTGAREDAALSA